MRCDRIRGAGATARRRCNRCLTQVLCRERIALGAMSEQKSWVIERSQRRLHTEHPMSSSFVRRGAATLKRLPLRNVQAAPAIMRKLS